VFLTAALGVILGGVYQEYRAVSYSVEEVRRERRWLQDKRRADDLAHAADRQTALTYLAQIQHIEMPGCKTALGAAAERGDTLLVQALLARGVGIEARRRWDGATALHGAAGCGRTETVRLLLERGAAIDARSPGGGTALTWAAAAGHVPRVALLLERGADFRIKNKSGDTALRLARRGKRPGTDRWNTSSNGRQPPSRRTRGGDSTRSPGLPPAPRLRQASRHRQRRHAPVLRLAQQEPIDLLSSLVVARPIPTRRLWSLYAR
jgi:hypothetical protein